MLGALTGDLGWALGVSWGLNRCHPEIPALFARFHHPGVVPDPQVLLPAASQEHLLVNLGRVGQSLAPHSHPHGEWGTQLVPSHLWIPKIQWWATVGCGERTAGSRGNSLWCLFFGGGRTHIFPLERFGIKSSPSGFAASPGTRSSLPSGVIQPSARTCWERVEKEGFWGFSLSPPCPQCRPLLSRSTRSTSW